MKLKLDENLGRRAADLLTSKGHDVVTVFEQGLCSAPDDHIASIAAKEGSSLVTLDPDFANCLRFTPTDRPGIVVLRPKPRTGWEGIETCLWTFLAMLEQTVINDRLWIVEPGRVREHRHGGENG